VASAVHKIKNRISFFPLTISKMLANDLVKDLAFSDPVRHLQRGSRNATSTGSASSDESDFHVNKIFIVGIAMIIVAVFPFRIFRTYMARRRMTATDASELPEDETLKTTKKSTLSKSRQAILELFKKAQVTMVSNDVGGTLQNKQFSRIQKLILS
jgi:hypothetical protein